MSDCKKRALTDHAFEILKEQGYVLPLSMLWSAEDAKRYFDVNDEQAYEIVMEALNDNYYLIDTIIEAIQNKGEYLGYKLIN